MTQSTTDENNDKSFLPNETVPQTGTASEKIDFEALEATIDQLEADANEISDYFRN